MFITFTSPVFKDLFALPQAPEGKSVGENEIKDHLPIVQMMESSHTIKDLLELCYPAFTSKLPELNIIEDIIALGEAADKYGMEDVMKYAWDALLVPPLIEQKAVCIFAIAFQNRWEQEAKVAARYTLHQPLLEQEYMAELEHITAGDFHWLEKYHLECVKKVEAIATSYNLTSKWATPVPGCYHCAYLPPNNTSTLFSRNNPVHTRPILKGWWDGCIQHMIAALMKQTCGETVCMPHFGGKALKHALKYKGCGSKEDLLHDLLGFSDRLAVQVERVISMVSSIQNHAPYSQAVKLLIGLPRLAIRI